MRAVLINTLTIVVIAAIFVWLLGRAIDQRIHEPVCLQGICRQDTP
jgi:hypothetical protein